MLIPTFFGIISLGFLEGFDFNTIVASGLGSQIVWFLIIFMVFTNIIDEEGLTSYFANWIMSREILSGHPWIFSFAFLFTAYFLGAVNPFAAMFLLWAILYSVCEVAGYKPYEAYPTVMIVGITLFAILGVVLLPISSNSLIILAAFQNITGDSINFASYAVFMIPLMIIVMLVFIFIARFVFKVNVTALENIKPGNITAVGSLTLIQKIICISLFISIVLLLIPSICSKEWFITQLLTKIGVLGVAMIVVSLLMILKIDGHPVINFEKMVAKGLPWGAIFITAYVLPLSLLLTSPTTGVQELFLMVVSPLTNLPPFLFLLVIYFVTTLFTNVANNTAAAVLMMPIILGYGEAAGAPSTALVVLLIGCAHLAIITPAACPMASIMFANAGWVKSSDVYKYALVIVSLCFPIFFICGYFWGNIIF